MSRWSPCFNYSKFSSQSLASSALTARSASWINAFKPRLRRNGAFGGRYEAGKGVGLSFNETLKHGDQRSINRRSEAFKSFPTPSKSCDCELINSIVKLIDRGQLHQMNRPTMECPWKPPSKCSHTRANATCDCPA